MPCCCLLPIKQSAEVKNGRLAMIGFSGMLHHALITHKGPIDQIMSADFVSAHPPWFCAAGALVGRCCAGARIGRERHGAEDARRRGRGEGREEGRTAGEEEEEEEQFFRAGR